MRNLLIFLLIFTGASVGQADYQAKSTCKTIRIAVIDSGFGFRDSGHDAHLCKYGHKDFSKSGKSTKNYGTATPVPEDTHGHGTNVTGLIEQFASKGAQNYCLVIIKYYDPLQTQIENVSASVNSLKYAINLKVDMINYSGGGTERVEKEQVLVKKYLKNGGIVVAAAGNEGQFLDGVVNTYYPAMYDKNIIVVGNLDIFGERVETSNYGPKVNTWENGFQRTAYGITMTGTSQATAITTGKKVAKMTSTCDKIGK